MSEKLSIDVINALNVIWDDYFPDDKSRQECLSQFISELKWNQVTSTLCDMVRERLVKG